VLANEVAIPGLVPCTFADGQRPQGTREAQK
jgi:hypothetical protein